MESAAGGAGIKESTHRLNEFTSRPSVECCWTIRNMVSDAMKMR